MQLQHYDIAETAQTDRCVGDRGLDGELERNRSGDTSRIRFFEGSMPISASCFSVAAALTEALPVRFGRCSSARER